MYLVTNRRLDENAKGIDRLGAKPSEQGPNELRLVEATRRGRGWEITILPDELTSEMKAEIGPACRRHRLRQPLCRRQAAPSTRTTRRSVSPE